MEPNWTALGDYLRGQPANKKDLTLTFADVEKIIGVPMPSSATVQAGWWNDQPVPKRPQNIAWQGAGWKAQADVKGKKVKFLRVQTFG